MIKHLAITTYQGAPALTPDDLTFSNILTQHNADITVSAIPWDQPGIDWSSYDLILPRSCWDYHAHITRFHDWLHHLNSIGAPIWNPASLLKWNSHKFYLKELASHGIDILPTLFSTHQCPEKISHAFGFFDCGRLVVKPAISAGARHTHVVKKDDLKNLSEIEKLLTESDYLLQPYSQTLVDEGEYSFIYFDQKLSHIINKTPQKGDFRSQPEFGSTLQEVETISSHVIFQVESILNHIPKNWLYARVDGIIEGDTFKLVELELIEPSLFMDIPQQGKHKNFVDAVLTKL